MTKKIERRIIFALIMIVAFLMFVWLIISSLDFSSKNKEVVFGVTFSHKYASQELGLDWTEVYWEIINNLGVKNIRLAAHWDLIEEDNGYYNFADFEWMIEEARKKDINIILAIGRRTPRWPECHEPSWLKDLSQEQQQAELLEMLKKMVEHFKKYENIKAWQVENEPLLDLFGECPKADLEFLKKEIELVKSLDERPVIVTDTGELSDWQEAASVADIFGTTMYKVVWNKYIGVWRYPWPPAYYYYKANKIQKKYNLDKIIVSELQAEPWSTGKNITQMDLKEQLNLFNRNDFENNLEYVKRAGFDEVYLWGVEWWYWLKKEQNMGEFWNVAKLIWQN